MSNRDEIFELAQLEVLGVLESPDVVRLDRMFREASPAVQREIVELQSTLASDEWRLLPMIDPSPALGWRVVARVMEDVDLQDEHGVPLASIGRKAKAGAVQASQPNNQGGTTTDSAPRVAIAEALAPWRRSSFLWRATAIILAGGLVASIAFNAATQREASDFKQLIQAALKSASADELLGLVASELPALLNHTRPGWHLAGVGKGETARVGVIALPTALLVLWEHLEAPKAYALRVVDTTTGMAKEVGRVSPLTASGGTKIAHKLGDLGPSVRWELIDEDGAVAYASPRE